VSTSNWLYRLGYLAVILVFLQVVEVALRVTAYLKQICCRPGDMFDFLLVAICFCCVLYGSTEVFYADDSSDSGSGSDSSSGDEEGWFLFLLSCFHQD
jgi:hypothetical protein